MNVNMGAIEFEISRLQKANADLRAQLQQEREGREKLAEAIALLAIPAEVVLAVHSDGEHIAPTTIAAFREGIAAARAALAQTEATPDSGGGL